MAKKVKLADIGAKLGVSAVTVSKALSGTDGVSDEMRQKIRALAEEMDYQPPHSGKEKKHKSYNIGIIISEKYFDQTQSFYWRLYQEVATRAISKECFTMLEIISQDNEKKSILPKLLDGNKVDGYILIGLFDNSYLKLLEKNISVPYIFLDFYDNKKDSDAVVTDNYLGMYRVVNHLIEMGHKKIAFVGTLMTTSSITDRYFGYCKALAENSIQIRNDYIVDDRVYFNGDMLSEDSLSLPKDMPSAFACNCDVTASTVINLLKKKGYSVPDDISVTGFDNYITPGDPNTQITTYEVDVKELAVQTLRIIIAKMSGEPYKKGVLTVPGKLVLRDTVLKVN